MSRKYAHLTPMNEADFFNHSKLYIGQVFTYDFYNYVYSDVVRITERNGVDITYITYDKHGNIREQTGDCGCMITEIKGVETTVLEQNVKQDLLFDPKELVI